MWEFLSDNWVWILLVGGMLFMHLGHGGHGGHQHGQASPPRQEDGVSSTKGDHGREV